jgi:PilZ domain-containing protein
MTHRWQGPLLVEPTRQNGVEQRLHERIRIGGSVRLLIDTATGPAIRVGQIVDLSESGCGVRVYKPVEAGACGQIEIDVGGRTLTMPVVVRWARDDVHSWKVGCLFYRPVDAKRALVRALLQRRRERCGPGGVLG